jgi:hypothetical protein
MVTEGDILVTQGIDGPLMRWRTENTLVNLRNEHQNHNIPIPEGFHSKHFVWNTSGCLQLPKGYSAVFTHPLNHIELPFFTFSGVVDDYLMPSGSIPFFLKKGFTGIIPKGTPMIQIIPFKRENWVSKLTTGLYEESLKNQDRSRSMLGGWYKTTHWKKKRYD